MIAAGTGGAAAAQTTGARATTARAEGAAAPPGDTRDADAREPGAREPGADGRDEDFGALVAHPIAAKDETTPKSADAQVRAVDGRDAAPARERFAPAPPIAPAPTPPPSADRPAGEVLTAGKGRAAADAPPDEPPDTPSQADARPLPDARSQEPPTPLPSTLAQPEGGAEALERPETAAAASDADRADKAPGSAAIPERSPPAPTAAPRTPLAGAPGTEFRTVSPARGDGGAPDEGVTRTDGGRSAADAPAPAAASAPIAVKPVEGAPAGGARPELAAAAPTAERAFAGAADSPSAPGLPAIDEAPRESRHAAALSAAPRADAAKAARPAEAARIVAQITQAASQGDADTVRIRLDPPELGRVSLSFVMADDGVTAVVSADRPETVELLRRHSEMLHRDLTSAGHRNVTLQFAGSDGGGANDGQGAERQRGGGGRETDETAITTFGWARAHGHLDIRL